MSEETKPIKRQYERRYHQIRETGERWENFKSINKAKQQSRVLQKAGHIVRVIQ